VAREEADQAQAAAAGGLRRAAGGVVGVEHGAKLPALWPQAARNSQGFAIGPRWPDGRRCSMTGRRFVGVVAGLATLMAALPSRRSSSSGRGWSSA
jgi:hypothetical protein